MGVIRILDAVTANQIAAGEVVERPSSVVKELVENAIDAGSTRIEVQIANSGLDYIRITDNGWGMTLQDALLAFERHATSKITTVDDLWTIESLGFRGEALPSIASVAKVELITRPAGSITAARIEIAGGKVIKVEETGAPQGTRIIVRDLFYNTPARKKHLKSPGTEMGLISEVLTRLALAYPRIAFSLTHNGRKQMQTTGTGQLVDAIISTQGVQSAKAFLPIKAGTEYFVVEGLLGGPELSRGTRGQQVLFVNGRYVRSKLVSQAVEEGYHSRLMIGRFPAFVLDLRVHPGQVDVNVHPTKMEVRFSLEGELQQFLVEAVRQALADHMSVPQLKVDGIPKPTVGAKAVAVELAETGRREEPVPVIQQEIYYPERNTEKNTETHSYPVSLAEHRATGVREGAQAESKAAWAEPVYTELRRASSTAAETTQDNLTEVNPTESRPTVSNLPDSRPAAGEFSQLQVLGQLADSYIIAAGPKCLYILDQHAVHERIIYESLLKEKRVATENGVTEAQMIFTPDSIDLPPLEADILVKNILLFREVGFTLEHFGGNSFLMRTAPQGLPPGEETTLFYDLLDSLRSEKHYQTDRLKIKENFLINRSCKSAIKARQPLTRPAMEELLRQLDSADNPYNCPHGRPTVLKYTGEDLGKAFKRT